MDYQVIPMVMRLRGIPRADWPEIFDCLRIMEDEALVTIHNK